MSLDWLTSSAAPWWVVPVTGAAGFWLARIDTRKDKHREAAREAVVALASAATLVATEGALRVELAKEADWHRGAAFASSATTEEEHDHIERAESLSAEAANASRRMMVQAASMGSSFLAVQLIFPGKPTMLAREMIKIASSMSVEGGSPTGLSDAVEAFLESVRKPLGVEALGGT